MVTSDIVYTVLEYADEGDLCKFIQRIRNKGTQDIETEEKKKRIIIANTQKHKEDLKKGSHDFEFKKQIFGYFLQICKGVRFIHSKKMLHKDLKPLNIFLKKDTLTIVLEK